MDTTEVTRRNILDSLIIPGEFAFTGRLGLVEFLGRIWHDNDYVSQDSKFGDYDIYRHCISFSDWNTHDLFYDILRLDECDDKVFFKFLENCVHPIVMPESKIQQDLVSLFNGYLSEDGFSLQITSHISGKAVYKVVILKRGVSGNIKNLIFAATGPKPDIILSDAINNDITIAKNEEYCLIYDRPISEQGLLWEDLLVWWADKQPKEIPRTNMFASALYKRLLESLSKDSPPERLLFETYYGQFRHKLGDKLPALIPQVYLHFDPKTISQLVEKKRDKRLIRQRMDFLLLFSNRSRIVLEVDGKQHYSINGIANPQKYAEMLAEDRRIRLQGYEVYRFGGAELSDKDQGKEIIIKFFEDLFKKHYVK